MPLRPNKPSAVSQAIVNVEDLGAAADAEVDDNAPTPDNIPAAPRIPKLSVAVFIGGGGVAGGQWAASEADSRQAALLELVAVRFARHSIPPPPTPRSMPARPPYINAFQGPRGECSSL